MKITKYRESGRYYFKNKFAWIGARKYKKKKKDFYQIGCGYKNYKSLVFNFKKKPILTNLCVITVLGIVIYPFYLLILWMYTVMKTVLWTLYYCVAGFYKPAIEDWGWSYLLLPILFWKILAIILIIKYVIL